MIYAAILGYGTVGSGVYKVINKNNAIVSKNAGDTLKVKYVLDLREFEGDPVMEVLTHDYNDILNDEEVSIVVETMGGLRPAYQFTKAALEAGKNVCTSNKELVAEHGHELMEIAKAHGVNYMFEASCGGGIPIIRPLMTSLTGDEIEEISGILNGTTNYILTAMAENGSDFDTALKNAQKLGYAELHPEADIEGMDPCRKIAILSSIAYGKAVDYHDIHCEGITKVTADDMKYAAALEAKVKLIASSVKTKSGYAVMVAPYMIIENSPLYSVSGVFNAVYVRGNMLGDSMFYGSGAGSLPTASAVVGDVVDCAKNAGRNIMKIWDEEKIELVPFEKIHSRYIVRVPEKDTKKARELFGDVTTITLTDLEEECAFITDELTEGMFAEKAEQLPDMISYMRVKF